MLLNTNNALENKLEKFSSDNLKSMLCIHTDISNQPDLIIDDLSTSTSHASNSESDSIVIKPVIVDTTCLENSCLNNHDAKGKIGHIRPNCYFLKSHRPWIKQDAPTKGNVENSSSSKYVPLHS